VGELPADLVADDLWPVGRRQADGFDGIRGGAQCVRAHVTDGYGLTGGSGRGGCCWSLYLADRHATDEAAANHIGSVQLSSSEGTGAGYGSARAVISWSFGLKQPQNPLCAIGGPRGDKTSVGFAERLWRSHHRTLHGPSVTPAISAMHH
jgi:hypothetical protein